MNKDKISKFLSNKKISNESINYILNIIDGIKYNNDIKNLIIDFIVDNDMNYNNGKKTKDLKKYIGTIFNLNSYELNNNISEIIGTIYPKYNINLESNLFGKYDESKIDNLKDQIDNYGYCQLDKLLDENICNAIIEKTKNIPFVGKSEKDKVIGINFNGTKSSTNWVEKQEDIINIPEVQQIITDPIILNIAQKYLGTNPINSQTNLWYSIANKKGDSSQQFHQDFADVKFLKVFIYLNDVNEKNGPHEYISKSIKNKILPKDYKVSQRLEQSWIDKYYNNDIVKIIGKKGAISFVDTNGFHRGAPLLEGHRIILQLEFTISTYWLVLKKLEKCNIKVSDNIKKFMDRYKDIYIKYNR